DRLVDLTGDEAGVHVDLPEVVHHGPDPGSGLLQQVVEHGGLAGAEVPGQHDHRNLALCHLSAFPRYAERRTRRRAISSPPPSVSASATPIRVARPDAPVAGSTPPDGLLGSSAPGAPAAGSSGAGSPVPGSSEPGSSESGWSEPGWSEPGSSEPGSSEPGSPEPGSPEPGSSLPGSSLPGSSSASVTVTSTGSDGPYPRVPAGVTGAARYCAPSSARAASMLSSAAVSSFTTVNSSCPAALRSQR